MHRSEKWKNTRIRWNERKKNIWRRWSSSIANLSPRTQKRKESKFKNRLTKLRVKRSNWRSNSKRRLEKVHLAKLLHRKKLSILKMFHFS